MLVFLFGLELNSHSQHEVKKMHSLNGLMAHCEDNDGKLECLVGSTALFDNFITVLKN